MTLRTLLVSLAACSAAQPAAVEPVAIARGAEVREDVDVHFELPVREGQRFRIEVTSEGGWNYTIFRAGEPVGGDTQQVSLVLEATATVERVSGHQGMEVVRYAVERFVSREDDVPLISPGSELRVVTGAEPAITVDGHPVDRALRDRIEFVVPVGPDEDRDALLGTETRQAVGGTWALDANAVAAALGRAGYPADAADVSGSSTLVETFSDPLPGYRVRSSLHARNFRIEDAIAIASAEIRGVSDLSMPRDRSHYWRRSRSTFVTRFDYTRGPESDPLRVVGERRSDKTEARSPLR